MGMTHKTHRLLSAAGSVNATLVAGAPVIVYGIQGFNARASAVYIKLYNKATAPDENDTPVKTLRVAASAPFAYEFADGYEFTLGLGYRMTTAVADNSTAALTAADIEAFNIDYG